AEPHAVAALAPFPADGQRQREGEPYPQEVRQQLVEERLHHLPSGSSMRRKARNQQRSLRTMMELKRSIWLVASVTNPIDSAKGRPWQGLMKSARYQSPPESSMRIA